MTFRPMTEPWLIWTLAAVLLALVLIFLVRRPMDRGGWVLRALMVLCAVGIVVRPGAGEVATPERVSDLEVLVVVDRTTSMSALDYDGDKSRLDGVRADLAEITRSMSGARFSLMTWGRFTRTELPFSSDTAAFQSVVDTMRREDVFDGAGSKVDAPLEEMTRVLTSAEENRPDRKRVVIFISDGENTVEEGAQESFEEIAGMVDDGIVLGYGTEDGGPMPIEEKEPGGSKIHDPEDYDDALSKLDEENLEMVADQMGVDYQHRTDPGGLDKWAKGVDRHFSDDDEESRAKHELFWIPGILLFGLGLLELWFGLRGFLAARREARAR
ncbi:MAG: VWA domain-containing protein [Nocardioides sp.]|nr:VWA domain-containing protein [Nocardioides sp.]